MTVLVAKQPVTLSLGVREKFTTPPMPIAAITDVIEVRLRRPTTLAALAWSASAKLKVEIAVLFDGVIYRCTGQASGGVRLNVDGGEVPQYVLRYRLPFGKFGGNAMKKLGELMNTVVSARVELTRIAGNAVTEIDVTSE